MFLSTLLAKQCILCCDYHRDKKALCRDCYSLLSPITSPPPVVLRQETSIDKVITAYWYEEPLSSLLHAFKYKHALYLKTFFGQLMLDALKGIDYQSDCLVPVPLHKDRLKQRGFNQAVELAKWVARSLRCPINLYLCEKIITTLPQVALHQQQRKSNVKGTFQVKQCPYKKITLIDDVVTTGSTVNEIAQLFKQEGVQQVDVLCCARVRNIPHKV